MSAMTDARRRELNADLDQLTGEGATAQELFDIADTLQANVAVRRALSDPGASVENRRAFAQRLFAPHVGAATLRVVVGAAGLRWPGPTSLVDALERQGVRAELRAAQQDGTLDTVEDDLFRFNQTVAGSSALADAIGDRRAPVQARQQLVADLLRGRTNPHVELLARRAVLARQRTFGLTVEGMLRTASELRNRALARVTVAQPLTDEQYQRLRALLVRQVGRGVDIQVDVDPRVLGGMRVQVGDEVIEGTVAHRLAEARRQFS